MKNNDTTSLDYYLDTLAKAKQKRVIDSEKKKALEAGKIYFSYRRHNNGIDYIIYTDPRHPEKDTRRQLALAKDTVKAMLAKDMAIASEKLLEKLD